MSTAFKKVLRKKQSQDKHEDEDSAISDQDAKNIDLPAEVSDNDSAMDIEDVPVAEKVSKIKAKSLSLGFPFSSV